MEERDRKEMALTQTVSQGLRGGFYCADRVCEHVEQAAVE